MIEKDFATSQDGGLDWAKVKPALCRDANAVTIVIAVYGALEETLTCIYSVLTTERTTPAHLVVIDDCSPDKNVFSTLRRVSDEGRRFTVWRNEVNSGFVHTANRGLLAAAGDVVLLNSDTIVTNGWLDRLVARARQDEAIASVSPMTNNATIVSYPRINAANELPADTSLGDLTSLFAMNEQALAVDVPVTVGFCMLLTQDAIQAVGGLDEGLFGIGYGEECDWCMRAASLGYKHIVAVDVFVYHVGSVSFSTTAIRRQELAARALAMRHPQYWHLIGRFCAMDPLSSARRAVDVRRILRGTAKLKGVVLQVLHGLGGGTQVYAAHLADLLAEEGYGSVFLKPDGMSRLTATANFVDDLPNLVFDCASDLPLARELLDGLPIVRRHIHALIGFSAEALAFVVAIPAVTVITVHDYVPLCPQITLLDQTGTFCDLPSHKHCNICVKLKPPPVPCEDIGVWRRQWLAILEAAYRVLAPSDFVKAAFQRVYPDLEIDVLPHSEGMPRALPSAPIRHRPPSDERRPRRVAVFGNLNHHKGIDIVTACAAQARDSNQALEFLLFGHVDIDEDLFAGKLHKMGAYKREDLPTLLAARHCDIGFLPSIWPETYSYVLSEILELELHPVVFNLGAQAERLRAAGVGTILPVGLASSSINARLLNLTPKGSKVWDEADLGAATMSAGSRAIYLERIYGNDWTVGQKSAVGHRGLVPFEWSTSVHVGTKY